MRVILNIELILDSLEMIMHCNQYIFFSKLCEIHAWARLLKNVID